MPAEPLGRDNLLMATKFYVAHGDIWGGGGWKEKKKERKEKTLFNPSPGKAEAILKSYELFVCGSVHYITHFCHNVLR